MKFKTHITATLLLATITITNSLILSLSPSHMSASAVLDSQGNIPSASDSLLSARETIVKRSAAGMAGAIIGIIASAVVLGIVFWVGCKKDW